MRSYKHKKTKNILLVTSSNFPFGGAGANVLRLLTIGLVKTGRDVHVLIQKGNQYGKIISANKRKGVIEGVPYMYCGYLLRPKNYLKKMIDNLAGSLIPLLILIKNKTKHKVDCLILYNGSAYECILLVLICKILRIPIINYVVEWYEKESIASSWLRLPLWWDFLFRMKILNRHFDGLIVTSKFLRDYYAKRRFSNKKIIILPNLVDLSFFNTGEKNSNTKKDVIRIGYCGSPTRKDGIDDLLLAFRIVHEKCHESELVIIGDTTGHNSVLSQFEIKAKKLGIFKEVTFTGLIEWEKIPSLLNSCDILVLARPSGKFAEAGFPTKLGEYMACKKPVVATKVGDIPLYLRDRENAMLAEPDNPESIASKICYLIENLEVVKKIGESGYLWAKNKLDYIKSTQIVGEFLDIFI